MRCAKCEKEVDANAKFCRACGQVLGSAPAVALLRGRLEDALNSTFSPASTDPDELMGTGISKVITGDGFLMVAIFLSVTPTAIGSPLWLLLLLPAFFLFGHGFSDVFQARQLRRRQLLIEADSMAKFQSAYLPVLDTVTTQTTRKLETKLARVLRQIEAHLLKNC